MWKDGAPRMPSALQVLAGWGREDLAEAIVRFRSSPTLAVYPCDLAHILGKQFTEKGTAELYSALGIRSTQQVDFLSMILPMVVMSDQSYISKVTFLFSIADFNSSGTINRPEFYIALRSLFKGLSRFFPSALPPSGASLEKATNRVFDKIDEDRSGLVDLEEILVFAYRSKGLRDIMAPFPGQDSRDFEELCTFAGGNSAHEKSRAQNLQLEEQGLRKKLMLTPDPAPQGATKPGPAKKKPRRPCQEPAIITKPRVYVMWSVFNALQTGAQVKCGILLDFIKADKKLTAALERGAGCLRDEGLLFNDESKQGIVSYVKAHLTSASSTQKLKERPADEQISMRALLSMLWTNVPEREINQSLRWCRNFQAIAAIRELLKPTKSAMVDPDYDPERDAVSLQVTEDDVQALFDVIDLDGNGKLSVQELIKIGRLSPEEATQMSSLWDRDRDGLLTPSDFLQIIRSLGEVVNREMKSLYHASLQSSAQGSTARAPPTESQGLVQGVAASIAGASKLQP